MRMTVEKTDVLPASVFDELYEVSAAYICPSLRLQVCLETTNESGECYVALSPFGVLPLKKAVSLIMSDQPIHIIIRNNGRLQSLMSGHVTAAGCFVCPYTLHNSDDVGSRGYLYDAYDFTTELESGFNLVGVQNIRVLSLSDSQSNYALATGWIEDPDADTSSNTIRTFRTAWGWA